MDKAYWLNYLSKSSPVITGQHLSYYTKDYAVGYRDYFEASQAAHGAMPYMPGLTIGNGSTTEQSKAALLFLSQKGFTFLNVDHHPMNPWTGGNSWDTTVTDMPNLNTNQAWLTELSRIKDILLYAKQLGITCLWRPLHEMNADNCFWWDLGSAKRSVAPFKAAWAFMRNCLADVDNLIWEYCPMNMGWSDVYVDMCPPADQFDVVGLDLYSDTATISKDGYTKLLSLGKPIGFGEAGPSGEGPMNCAAWVEACRTKYPAVRFIQFWHSWDTCAAALQDAPNAALILANDLFLNSGAVMLDGVFSIALMSTNPEKAWLTWDYPAAQSVTITGVGNVAAKGKKSVTLANTGIAYALTATRGRQSVTATVTAEPLIRQRISELTAARDTLTAKVAVYNGQIEHLVNLLPIG